MGKPTAFMELGRQADSYRPAALRCGDFKELYQSLPEHERRRQASRCMDCGVPFCQSATGCPLCNLIPEWNDLISHGRDHEAYIRLSTTNNFPEFTGRVCPALCEGACSLGLYSEAMTNRNNERYIADNAWKQGWITPRIPPQRTGKRVGVIGSGPAGLAVADQLNQAGHNVTIFERADRFGGLLVYGIPNMKLDKRLIIRRIALMRQEGVHFVANAHVGVNVRAEALYTAFDALVLATGATQPRDMPVPGRELDGIHFAVDFLTANTRSLLDSGLRDGKFISARDRRVVVIGGGDTGNDCIGTAIRHGCREVINLELLPPPPDERADDNPWPQWPRIMRVDYGHAEAVERFGHDPRRFNVLTKAFLGDDAGRVKAIHTVNVEWVRDASDGRPRMIELPGSEATIEADMVLLALGFTGPEQRLADRLGIEVDARSNFKATYGRFATNLDRVFAAGDCRRGQSLVAWAIAEGRACAHAVDRFLMGESHLSAPGVNLRSAMAMA